MSSGKKKKQGMEALPPFILRYLQGINIHRYSPAFLKLTPPGILEDWGGDIQRFGINHPVRETPVSDAAGYLEGFFPLKRSSIILPNVETTPGIYADLHLLRENDRSTWVLFLDQTEDQEKLRSLLQRCNELQRRQKMSGPPSPGPVCAQILRQLNIAVFQEIEANRFAVIGVLPSWFRQLFEKCAVVDPQGEVNPVSCFPFLELFINTEAREAWKHDEHLMVTSDLWIESDAQGNEYYFEAVAAVIDQKKILLVRMVNAETCRNRFHIQKGREKSLAYEKVVKTEKMLRSFLANMSHELRTPMNAILGISKMLHKYYGENLTAKQIEGLQLIYQSGERLLKLINDLLDLSKLEAGKMQVLLKPAAVDDVIGAVEKLIAPLIRDKEIAFSVKKGPGVPLRIVTDEEKIHQVLLNLLGNAVKFTPRGEIRLEVDAREEKLYFEVHDTGIGISEAHLPYIFETFTQVDGSVSGEYGGTGLGLALCKKLLSLLKGEITARSQLGRGSVFTFQIPLSVPTDPIEMKS